MSKYNVTFAERGATVTVTAPRGARLINVAEKVGANIPFGCKENDCGDCMVEVLKGAENLCVPSALELELLKNKLAKPECRLACQAMILGDVTIRSV